MIPLSELRELIRTWWGLRIDEIEPLAGDGSARRFFRLKLSGGETLILIWPQPGDPGRREARSYYRLGLFFRAHGIPVPEILAFREPEGVLLVEDLGNTRLSEHPERERLYPRVIHLLVRMQELAPYFPREAVLETLHYDEGVVWEREVLYFEEWYLWKRLGRRWLPQERALWKTFVKDGLSAFTDTVVLHRDFQSRNIMVRGDRVYLIDFQSARLGPPSYDLAALLYDPYGRKIPRDCLLDLYLNLSGRTRKPIERELHYTGIFRLMQALGAFSKLSYLGKKWFEPFIPVALKRLWSLLPPPLRRTLPP
ncbi:aminoglycoside phosphotransferase family protein [Thermosulfurimonas sp. F29]|uniref:aminoglycoside phosphotransferase family protein n=1 Tax=Thermosulfurimonas sp. F29 TaxID=2867247 RepID=UPI001C83CEF5|nr:phosphotransferase [Thermosulfurimonas sp. F29]MBX6423581.1 phosphotransferase [Thermosulfurimonas sp. F29]